jgi:hypothetical protein
MAPGGTLTERRSAGGPASYVCLVLAALTAVAASENPLLVIVSLTAVAIIWMGALSSPFRVLMAAYLLFEWLQASGSVWITTMFGIDMSVAQTVFLSRGDQIFQIPTMAEAATVLAAAAVVMVALGARLFAPRLVPFEPCVSEFSALRLFVGYFALLLVSMVVGPFTGGGLAQPLIVLGSLRLAFALLLLFFWLTRRRGLILLLIVVAIEVVVGFTGFFSGFKSIFIVLGTGLLMVRRSHWARVAPVLFIGFVSLLVLATVWTAVKVQYRAALNQHSPGQNVTIGVEERLETLLALVEKLGADDFTDGAVKLAMRIAYTEYLAKVLEYVPDARPYEHGAVWGEAIKNVLTPRILFSDKAVLSSDSERTMLYTGENQASGEQGTSISIGYVGDSYIDFGIPGALAIPFMLGVFYALIARHILAATPGRDITVGIAVLVIVLSPVQQFEISSIKLFPGVLWAWIVGSFAVWIVWPRVRSFFCAAPSAPSPRRINARPLLHG